MNWKPKKHKPWPVQLSVSFPRHVHDLIVSESQRLGMSKSEYVRQCVYKGLLIEEGKHGI